MTMRLIDADALIESLNKKHTHFCELCGDENTDINYAHEYAVNMIGDAPTAEPTGDLISREDALTELNGACSNWQDDARVQEIVMALPSAEPKTGKWIRKTEVLNSDGQQGRYYWHECDQCGERPPYTKFMNENLSNYCPNCGAKMGGGDNEAD